jgi:2-methylcitrate dehydratase
MNDRMTYDPLLVALARYALGPEVGGEEAFRNARMSFADAVGCALRALELPACRRVLPPWSAVGAPVDGLPVPGLRERLDPVQAAFALGTTIRWLDYNDTWLAREWAHPSDNLGGLWAAALLNGREATGRGTTMRTLLAALVKAYEIQGVLALGTALNLYGFDHVFYVRLATVGAASWLLGADEDTTLRALSNAVVDGAALRAYRHAPNTGSRKSWAAGDATARGLWHVLLARRGEMGYPRALSTPTWGFEDSVLRGERLALPRPLGSYVMENILYKVAYPAEFHAQTAVEAAVALHAEIGGRAEEIEHVEIETQEAAVRIIDKTGPLHNPADRDHCLQYMVAVALLRGTLTVEDYEDERAGDPRIDALRSRMTVRENPAFTRDYHDADKRTIPNAVRLVMRDGRRYERQVAAPLGHRSRRDEARPLLVEKFRRNARTVLPKERVERLSALCFGPGAELDAMTVEDVAALLAV